MKYRAVLIQTASCVVEFDAPKDATPEQLEAAALAADTPSLCWECASSERNQSLNIDGEWDLLRDDETNKPEIDAEEAR
ncbi:hypothetical protein ACIRQH_34740 [Streptomyces sp. NPDC102279]|uniref:hypothetical protein n=1 Tax=Streptomyces sp. NPDC102279 TaxID=3366153 RepID=UPI003803513B